MLRNNQTGLIGLLLIALLSGVILIGAGVGAFYFVKSQSSKTASSQSPKPLSSSSPQTTSQIPSTPKEKMLFVDFRKAGEEAVPSNAVFLTYDPQTGKKQELFNFDSNELELFEAGVSPDKKKAYWISHLWPLARGSFDKTPGAYDPKLYIYKPAGGIKEIKVTGDSNWRLNISTVEFNADSEFRPCHYFSDSRRMACLLTGQDPDSEARAKIITIDTESAEILTSYKFGQVCPPLPKVGILVEDFGTGNLDSVRTISNPDQPCYQSEGIVWIYLKGINEDGTLVLRNNAGDNGSLVLYSFNPQTNEMRLSEKEADIPDSSRFLNPVSTTIKLDGESYRVESKRSTDGLTSLTSIINMKTSTTQEVAGFFVNAVNF